MPCLCNAKSTSNFFHFPLAFIQLIGIMTLVMNTNSVSFTPPFTWAFHGPAGAFEDGLVKYLKKACGYPRHRAWADRLDMSHMTFCEDYARENGLRISNITTNADGTSHIAFEKKNSDWLR